MATKQRRPRTSGSNYHKNSSNMRPVISSDIMGNRNVEVVPVGAWVETAEDDILSDAVRAAQIEEEKINRMKIEKENRLRHFQKQTRQRVMVASQLQRLCQVQKAEQAFELERKVVQQSTQLGNTTRKDTCLVRSDMDTAIRKRLLEKYGEDVDSWENHKSPLLQSQSEESHHATDMARQQLVSKKIAHSNDSSNNNNLRPETEIWASRGVQVPTVRKVVDVPETHLWPGKLDQGQDMDSSGSSTSRHINKDTKDNTQEVEDESDVRPYSANHRVSGSSGHKKRSRSARHQKSAYLATIILRDSESDVQARQRRQQAAIARKIFMDRERETVRENIRRLEHRKKIQSLKKEKEIYRQELENLAYQKLEPSDPATGESLRESRLIEQMKVLHVQELKDRQQSELKKAREMKRYLNALRHTLMEKVKRHGLQLPCLCACGGSAWDTHPDTCANNCFFYKNPRAYARALQSLLSSQDIR